MVEGKKRSGLAGAKVLSDAVLQWQVEANRAVPDNTVTIPTREETCLCHRIHTPQQMSNPAVGPMHTSYSYTTSKERQRN